MTLNDNCHNVQEIQPEQMLTARICLTNVAAYLGGLKLNKRIMFWLACLHSNMRKNTLDILPWTSSTYAQNKTSHKY